jgi:3'(2'), 5'-bisphosphate nucleotidase|tara:strand:+ start:523 stop:1356 length:834 start_codon:yes stop_codon:yes gene_type:complete
MFDRKISHEQLMISIVEIAKKAGMAITEIYNSDFNYQLKKDASPITEADNLSHKIITERLNILTPEIPIISEENCDISYKIRSEWKQYWLVDPMDGTKEFIKKNGEFTVNIALIDQNIPILGVIHIPVTDETYWGSEVSGSFYQNKNSDVKRICVSENHNNPIRIVVSRSHPSKILNDLLKTINDYEIIKVGSSIKFCHVASGKADCYPRFGPTSEWDTAAGEAIVRAAGGHVMAASGNSMNYNEKETFLNPNFIVSNDKITSERILSLINTRKHST